jgi:GT2 family glycosyltransferase
LPPASPHLPQNSVHQLIQIIVVLYRTALEDSSSYCTLRDWLALNPEQQNRFRLLVADNSPEPQAMPPDFLGTYLHDGSNPGLARRYNTALAEAEAGGCTWLLTLDQDTTLTPAYFEEIASRADSLAGDTWIVALAPKLFMNGRLLSPHSARFRRGHVEITKTSTGVVSLLLRVFNSAALLRVSAVRQAGGFPEEYWLDYLDHATFHRMQMQGGQVYLLDAVLEHELAEPTIATPQGQARLFNRMRAEERFHFEHGTFTERTLHQIDLLRQVIGLGRRGHFAQAMVRIRILFHLK